MADTNPLIINEQDLKQPCYRLNRALGLIWDRLASVQSTSGVGSVPDLKWIPIPLLQNSWVLSSSDVTYSSDNNFLYLKGKIIPGTTNDGTLLFTLPIKPKFSRFSVVAQSNSVAGSGWVGWLAAMLFFDTDGTVSYYGKVPGSTVNGLWIDSQFPLG